MASTPHHAAFELEYASPEAARVVAAAIGQEVGEIDDDRSSTRLERTGQRLEIEVAAADLVALRAAANTWLSLVGVAEDVDGTVDGG